MRNSSSPTIQPSLLSFLLSLLTELKPHAVHPELPMRLDTSFLGVSLRRKTTPNNAVACILNR